MDKANLFTEDNDFNICKSWLCGSTDGFTWSLSSWFDKKLYPCPDGCDHGAYENIVEDCYCSQEWEDAIWYKYDYKVDDPKVDEEAQAMADRLNAYVEKLNSCIADLAQRKEA